MSYVNASLADLPLKEVLSAFSSSVADTSAELTSLYVTQLLALAHGVDAASGDFGDDEAERAINSINFSVTNAEGVAFEITIPITAFMPPPVQVLSATLDLTVLVREVLDRSSSSDFALTYGKEISGGVKLPWASVKKSSSLKVSVSKEKQQSKHQSSQAELKVFMEIGPGSTVGNDLLRTLYDASTKVLEKEAPAAP